MKFCGDFYCDVFGRFLECKPLGGQCSKCKAKDLVEQKLNENKVKLLTNGDCYAIYINNELKSWGDNGRCLTFILEELGFDVTNGNLPELNGEPPINKLN